MLEIRHLSKSYGDTHAIGDLEFTIGEREFVCVVGPSGCGKTTLLKCMSGLLAPTSGEVVLNGTPVTRPPEEMALVFQEYSRSLMPWMSVRKNVALPLRHKSKARALEAGRRGGRGGRPHAASSTATRGSSPAACSSAWRSPARSPTSRRSC